MIFFVIFIIIIFSLYVFIFYKNKIFTLRSIYGLPIIFLFLSLFFALLSFFNFKINIEDKINIKSSDIVFILDVSKSMLALDYGDKSRLEVSKEIIKNYILNNSNNRYSLIIFSGDATALIPLTKDVNLFLTFLESVDEKSILKGGTNFLEALKIGIMRFSDIKNGGAIVFLSDFEPILDSKKKDNLLNSLNFFLKTINDKNIKIFGIGIGNEKPNKIIEGIDIFGNTYYKKDNFGNDVITKFDNVFFNDFAKKINMEKFKINTIDDFNNIYFTNLPKNEFENTININKDFSRYLMIISFLFFLIYLILFYYFDKKGE